MRNAALALCTLCACDQVTLTTGGECAGRSCAEGFRCYGAECRKVCTPSVDCGEGFACEGGVCLPASMGGGGHETGSGGFIPGSSGPRASSRPAAPPSSGVDCAGMAGGCFTGSRQADGSCTFAYRCPEGQLCAGAGNTCMPMTGDCFRLLVRTRAFVLCNTAGGWFDSQALCHQRWPGFELASFRTEEEQDAMAAFLDSGVGWIGLTDRAERGYSTEGIYVWSDGSPFTFGAALHAPPWCAAQPDQGTATQDCVALRAASGNADCWDDTPCDNQFAFICAR